MSDVTVNPAPASSVPSAPASPAPAQSEVVVNQAPTNQPQPVGSQAPQKPEGQEANKNSGVSRREAIANAFKRSEEARNEASKAPKEKQATSGDKQRQVATNDKQAAEKPQQYREGGKFARDPARQPQDGATQQPPVGQQPQVGQQQQRHQPLHESAPFRNAPQRFSEQARGDWHGTPESVRGAVHQMQREFAGAYEKYKGDYEVMQSLRPFQEVAVRQGTTLAAALNNYTSMEGKLRSDLIGGLDVIVNNLKLTHPDSGQPVTLRDVAYHILNMSPDQHRMTAQQNQQAAADMRIGQLHQMVENLAKGFGQMQYAQKYQATRSQVDQFAEKHPRFDALADLIKVELDHGYTLEQAYARANMLRPGNATAAQTRNTSAQTRRTSISGAPDGNGSTGPAEGRRKADVKPPTRREAIAKAMRRANGV